MMEQPDDLAIVRRLNARVGVLQDRLRVLTLEVQAEDQELSRVAKALLRIVVVQAGAVARLVSRAATAEAAYTNVRTQFEVWSDLRYLLLSPDLQERRQRAHFAILYGFKQGLDAMRAVDWEDVDFGPVELRYQEICARDPDSYKVFDTKQYKRHWSGLLRVDLLRSLQDKQTWLERPTLAMHYKILSWNSHGDVAGVSNVRALEDDGIEKHAHYMAPTQLAEHLASGALLVMDDAWSHYCDAFGLEADSPG